MTGADFDAKVLIEGQEAKQWSPSLNGNHKEYYIESAQGKAFQVQVEINNQSLFRNESESVDYNCKLYIDGVWQRGRILESTRTTSVITGTRVSGTEKRNFVFAKAPAYEPGMESNINAGGLKHGCVGVIQIEFCSGKIGARTPFSSSTSSAPIIRKNILANHFTQLGETVLTKSNRYKFKYNDRNKPDYIVTIHYCSLDMLQARDTSDAEEYQTSSLNLKSEEPVGPSNHSNRTQESSLISKNRTSKLWVKFKSNNAVKVSIEDCEDVDDFLKSCKKELSPLLDSFASAQLLLSTTGGTFLEPDDPLPDTNTAKTPLLITVASSAA